MAGTDFDPTKVRYIKLGQGGAWAADAFARGLIPFGYHQVNHAAALAACHSGNWDEVRRQLYESGKTPAGVSKGVREVQEFYTSPATTLWVTFAQGHLWWAFADGLPEANSDITLQTPSRFLGTRHGWSKTSLTGEPLTVRSLSSSLTRTGNYRMTICAVDREDYLLRRIRGEVEPLAAESGELLARLRTVTGGMIGQLHWEELETLVDLIFARDGWQRTSVLGKDQPDVDLILQHRTSGLTASVQVKASASQSDLTDYLERFDSDGSFDRFYFVCANSRAPLSIAQRNGLHLWQGDTLAAAALGAGLLDWLVERTR